MARSLLTAKKREKFLARLAEGYSVKNAAYSIGLSRQMMYEMRKNDADLLRDWEAAVDAGTDVLEDIAFERAKETSDLLLIFLLKARRPELYRETVRQEHTGASGGPIEIAPANYRGAIARFAPTESGPVGHLPAPRENQDALDGEKVGENGHGLRDEPGGSRSGE